MVTRDHTFAIALIASVLLHAAIVFVVADDAVRPRGDTTMMASTAKPQDVSYVAPPPSPPQRLDTLFGDAFGKGDAVNVRHGDEPLLSREGGQNQGFLSRDPVGLGKIDKEPSMSVLPNGSAALVALPTAPPPAPLIPFGIADRTGQSSVPHVTRPAGKIAPPTAGPDAPGTTAGVPEPAADPAVMSDSESDPFSKKNSDEVVFQDGRVEARLGRKVKTIRPHLSFASQVDLMSMQFPRLVVRVHIHTDGSVRRVDIVKSSGSVSADQEVKVALYEWWFEPTKQNVVEFPIIWR